MLDNLQNLKTELFLEHSQPVIESSGPLNFYNHHHLPTRPCVKSREGTSKLSVRPRLGLTPSKSPHHSKPVGQIVGRRLFQEACKIKVPGPGSYEPALRSHSSHCYIQKEEQFVQGKIAKKLRRRQLINQCRGPGIYNPEQAFTRTSRTRSTPQLTFSQTYFTRCILPDASKQGFYLASTLSQRFIRNDVPGPQKYDHSMAKLESCSMSRPIAHLISTTERSSIVRAEVAPPPGFYKVARQFEQLAKSRKSKIRYKFVYGHPS